MLAGSLTVYVARCFDQTDFVAMCELGRIPAGILGVTVVWHDRHNTMQHASRGKFVRAAVAFDGTACVCGWLRNI
jgi:hypothetical protein